MDIVTLLLGIYAAALSTALGIIQWRRWQGEQPSLDLSVDYVIGPPDPYSGRDFTQVIVDVTCANSGGGPIRLQKADVRWSSGERTRLTSVDEMPYRMEREEHKVISFALTADQYLWDFVEVTWSGKTTRYVATQEDRDAVEATVGKDEAWIRALQGEAPPASGAPTEEDS